MLGSAPEARWTWYSPRTSIIVTMAAFLTGHRHDDKNHPCHIIDTGHVRERDLRLEITGSPLEAVMANEVWAEIYDRLAQLAEAHRTTICVPSNGWGRRRSPRITAASRRNTGSMRNSA